MTTHATVGYAAIVLDSGSGNPVLFRCPVQCNDTKVIYDEHVKWVHDELSNSEGWDTLTAEELKALYWAACCTLLGVGMMKGDTTRIGLGREIMHYMLGKPMGYVAVLSLGENDVTFHEADVKVWKRSTYKKAKESVDSFIEFLRAQARRAA